MRLKIVKRGKSRNWYIRGTVRGCSVDESTGTDNEALAKEIRDRRELEILQRSVYGARETASWLEASVGYVDMGGEARFLAPINEHFGMLPLAKIDQAAVDRAARAIFPRAASSTVNRQFYTPVSAVLKHAAANNLCDEWNMRRPKQPEGRVRWIEPHEAEALLSECAPHMRPLVIFALYTGARLSEALYLNWREVDLSRAHVSFLRTKTAEPRGVPLHRRVLLELANLPHREGAVFLTNRGAPYSIRASEESAGGQIKTGFNGACRRAGIVNFTPHDLRHTWATWHYQQNRDLIALQHLGGWKSPKMVMRYAHTNVSHHKGGIDALPWGESGEPKLALTKTERKSKT